MSADFWAGYISGAVGIIVGNPLDIVKVQSQAKPRAADTVLNGNNAASATVNVRSTAAWATGTAAPILGYGALNALLFVSYNRSESGLNQMLSIQQSLWTTWLAGAMGGLATWVVSTPTELVKCRAQMTPGGSSSWAITKVTLRLEGVRGLYLGGTVTALRDSIGYGFYFWSYELTTGLWQANPALARYEGLKTLLCGGLAGIVTWASIFPLDLVKTRLQTQQKHASPESSPLLPNGSSRLGTRRIGAVQIAKQAYAEGGLAVFFRGLTVCSIRAFIVNAVQWSIYEWVMQELGQGKARPSS